MFLRSFAGFSQHPGAAFACLALREVSFSKGGSFQCGCGPLFRVQLQPRPNLHPVVLPAPIGIPGLFIVKVISKHAHVIFLLNCPLESVIPGTRPRKCLHGVEGTTTRRVEATMREILYGVSCRDSLSGTLFSCFKCSNHTDI